MIHKGVIEYTIETTDIGTLVRIKVDKSSETEADAAILHAATELLKSEAFWQKKKLNKRSSDEERLHVSDINVAFQIINLMRDEHVKHIQDITGGLNDN